MDDTRKIFFDAMAKLAEKDKDIIMLLGDLGFSFYENFERRFPNQIINMGAAEQNAINVACGLALSGFHPYIY